MLSRIVSLTVLALGLAFAQLPASAAIWDSVPDETLEAFELTRDSSPKELYEKLTERYLANYTKGKFADLWEPIPMDMYLAPTLFYEAPDLDLEATRADCATCHTDITHGWVKSWEKSAHANLDEIRNLPDSDSRAYKKEVITEVESNLHSMGLLDEDKQLAEVGCIDCHMGIGKESGNHKADLRMPDRSACGACHVRQFAEAESEFDTAVWPQGQWAQGHPSHTVDYTASVETATWAALYQHGDEEVAASCTMCHTNQPKCDNCHTRHEFTTVEARKPEACATCHNGVDHNEFEQYMFSKHGTQYATRGDSWDWNVRLADQISEGGFTGPTCVSCHFEYKGEYTHNVTRKVRWGFLPTPDIADNLDDPWFKDRKQAWVETCSQCHSPRFSETYLTFMDDGIKKGTAAVEETRAVVQALYDEGLLVGQKTNRPALPEPEQDEPGAFASLFFADGNQFTTVDRVFAEMWEQHVARYFKGLEHVNPGGWAYSHGWGDMMRDQTIINEQDVLLRERADFEKRLQKLEGTKTSSYDNADQQPVSLASLADDPRFAGSGLALLGGGLLLGGFMVRRRSPADDEDDSDPS